MKAVLSQRRALRLAGSSSELDITAATAGGTGGIDCPMELIRIGKPLCRRYSVVLFSLFSVDVQGGDATETQLLRWALGSLTNCDSEPMGVWPATACEDQRLRQRLRARGVERIGALIGDDELASVMDVAVATPAMCRTHLAAITTAVRLHTQIERAVRRGAPFIDCDSAVACVSQVLQRADVPDATVWRRTLRDQALQRTAQTLRLRASAGEAHRS